MSSEIKRWDVQTMDERTSSDGRWVLHSDHEVATGELTAATARWFLRAGEYLKRAHEAEAEVARLLAEVEAYRKDAERYRWLRERASSDRTQVCHYGNNWSWNLVAGDLADKTIDAAMGADA